MDFVAELGLNLGIFHKYLVLSDFDGFVYSADSLFQKVQIPLFLAYDLFPVPLVHIYRVQIVQMLVGAKGVHIGVDSSAGFYSELGELKPLPFGQRMHHFGPLFSHVLDREAYGSFHSVKFVIQTGIGEDNHRCGDSQKGKLGREVVLEHILYALDGLFGVLDASEQIPVTHNDSFFKLFQVG